MVFSVHFSFSFSSSSCNFLCAYAYSLSFSSRTLPPMTILSSISERIFSNSWRLFASASSCWFVCSIIFCCCSLCSRAFCSSSLDLLILFIFSFVVLGPSSSSRSRSSSAPSSCLGNSLTLALSSRSLTFLPFLANLDKSSSTDSSLFLPIVLSLFNTFKLYPSAYADICCWPSLDYSMICLNFWISSSYCFKRASFGSMLTLGLFLIFFALEAYLRVVNVSS